MHNKYSPSAAHIWRHCLASPMLAEKHGESSQQFYSEPLAVGKLAHRYFDRGIQFFVMQVKIEYDYVRQFHTQNTARFSINLEDHLIPMRSIAWDNTRKLVWVPINILNLNLHDAYWHPEHPLSFMRLEDASRSRAERKAAKFARDAIKEVLQIFALRECYLIRTEEYRPLPLENTDVGGTVDLSFISATQNVMGERIYKLHVFDLKTGAADKIKAENNEQLILYATALGKAAGDNTPYDKFKVEEVELGILQPSLENYSYHTMNIGDPAVITKRDITKKLREGDTRPNPGAHCRYCNAKKYCPAIRKNLEEIMKILEENKNVGMLTGEQKHEIMKSKTAIVRLLQEIEYEYMDRMLLGEEFDDMILDPVVPRRVYANENDAAALLKEKIGEDKAYVKKLIAPSQAINALSNILYEAPNTEITKKQSCEEAKLVLQSVIVSPTPTKYKLKFIN